MAHDELIQKLFSINRYLNIQNWLGIHPAPKDFVTESFKNFCQFAADCPTVEVVVRPVLKVRPRDGRWIFWFERFIYFKACPWLSTFQISFHFHKYLVICKKIFAAKRAPWSHGRGGLWFLLLWVDCTGLKLENYYFFTFTFSRPEVRKLLLFYVFTFSRPEVRKLFRIYVFTFSRPEVRKLFRIYVFTFSRPEVGKLFRTFSFFLNLKLENYSIFRWGSARLQ